MRMDVIRCTLNLGVALATGLAALAVSLAIYRQLNLSHPLEGGIVATAVVLGSPLILAFLLLAVFMTKQGDLAGAKRMARHWRFYRPPL